MTAAQDDTKWGYRDDELAQKQTIGAARHVRARIMLSSPDGEVAGVPSRSPAPGDGMVFS